jgi:hypothetical protein
VLLKDDLATILKKLSADLVLHRWFAQFLNTPDTHMKIKALSLFLSTGVVVLIFSSSVAQQGNPDAEFEHPKNLKVLPKNISAKDLHETMRTWSRSLGVRCGFCHEIKPPAKEGDRPEANYASDKKDEKRNARKMFTMMHDINSKYLGKMDKSFEVTCVSCHRGSPKPMVSVDSLPKPAGK